MPLKLLTSARTVFVYNYAISLRDILSTIIDCHEPFEHKLDIMWMKVVTVIQLSIINVHDRLNGA